MGIFIRHMACENCGSSDGNSLYADGSTYCFVCKSYGGSHNTNEHGDEMDDSNKPSGLLAGRYMDIPKRKLREETCRKFQYQVGEDENSQPVHLANYCDASGRPRAQKIRAAGKKFRWVGERSETLPLYGQHLWSSGKFLIICEGEIDALTVAQAFDLRFAVVSLPDGAQSAVKAIKAAYEYLEGFETVVLCLDNDEAGEKATQAIAEILPVGRVSVMRLRRKDANDVLVNDGAAPIVDAFWKAAPWRPDGIVSGEEFTLERMKVAAIRGFSLPWPAINDKLGGIIPGTLTLITAGSGIGKSTAAREIAYHLHQHERLTIGNIFLEESTIKTAQAYVALDNGVRLKDLRQNPSILSDEQWKSSLARVLHQRMYFYDHFGSLESDRLLSKIRYMRQVLKCDVVILDHISMVVAAQEGSKEGERKDIDRLMVSLRSLIQETGLTIIAIVHLNQPEGKAHEEGGRVTLRNLRGSGSLKQLSDCVIALERDQQNDDKEKREWTTLRVLKDREDGQVGEMDILVFNEQGRMIPLGGL